MNSITLPSYAKINIGLTIKGKRSDGFHEVETILQQIDLKDEIKISRRSDKKIVLRCGRPNIPTDDTNLCVRAALLLRTETGIVCGLDIDLIKKIPAGAGLGGGSSNAAVVLLALNKLLDLRLDCAILEQFATQLGTDVPFFIRGGTALATGRGEILQPLKPTLAERRILIVFTGVSVSTKWAYSNLNLNLTMNKKNITLRSFIRKNINDLDLFEVAANDFEDTVFSKYPELSEIKHHMIVSGAVFSSLTGSGSAVFGVFDGEDDVRKARRLFPGSYELFSARFTQWGFPHVE